MRFETATQGRAVYSETGGIRQVAWRAPEDDSLDRALLDGAFAQESRYA
jgi:hypothetical protein